MFSNVRPAQEIVVFAIFYLYYSKVRDISCLVDRVETTATTNFSTVVVDDIATATREESL